MRTITKFFKKKLVKEQKQFCAYTEKYIQELDSSEVEHFNPVLKYDDDDYNYYAVIREANLMKKDEIYKNAPFLKSLFFQDQQQLNKRIVFSDNIYIETDEKDHEARDFIDYLCFNHPSLYEQRKRHVKRLKRNFTDAGNSKKQRIKYFNDHKEDLSFITAIEKKIDINLYDIIT